MSTTPENGFPALHALVRLWRWLTGVPNRIRDPERQRQLQLLSGLLVVLIPLVLAAIIAELLLLPDFRATFITLALATALLLVAYGLARNGHYTASALMTIGVVMAGSFAVVLLNPHDGFNHAFLFLGMFLGRLLFGTRGVWATTIINLLGVIVVLPWLGLPPPSNDPLVAPIFLVIMAALLQVAIHYRDTLERDRRSVLEMRERKFRTILDHLQDTYYRVGLDGHIEQVSSSASQLLGYGPEELVGMSLASFYVEPEGRTQFLATLEAHGGAVQNYEAELRRRDGSTVWVSTNAHYIHDIAGQVTGIEGTSRDVTERKRIEANLLNIAEGLAAATGDTFFQTLVAQLTRLLQADVVFVGELIPDRPDRIRTVAVQSGDQAIANFEYELRGTPCENVVGRETCAYPRNVQIQFPADHMLIEMGIQAYVGTPLFDSRGAARGLLAALYRHPLGQDQLHRSTLEIFAVRAATELERRRAEQALRASESYLRAVISNAPVVLFTFDHDGIIRLSEGKGLGALQLKSGEAVGQSIFEMYRDYPQICVDVRRALSGESLVRITELGPAVFEVHYQPVRGPEGKVETVIGLAIDITERRRTERALVQSESNFRTLTENANVGILVNYKGKHVFANPRMLAMLGYALEEIHQTGIEDLVHPDERSNVLKRFHDRKAGKPVASVYETVFVTKAGEPIPVEITATLTPWAGEPAGLAFVHDIRERKQAARALQESEALLAKAQEVAHIGSFDWNIVTNKVIWSRETYQLFGEDPDHPSADIWTILARALRIEDQHRLGHAIEQVKQGIREPLELHLRRPDGAERVLWTEGEILSDSNGNPYRMIGVMQDITERKRNEQQQRALFDAVPDLLFRIRADGTYLDFKPSPAIPTLQAPEQFLGRRVRDVLPVDVAEQSMQAITMALSTGRIQTHTYQLEINGSRREYEARIVPFGADEVLGVVRDITERKHAEQQWLNVARGVSLPAGNDFFEVFIRQLAKTLEADYGFVAILMPGETVRFETLVLLGHGKNLDNIVFDLEGTPCAEVVRRGTCSFQRDVCREFPENTYLVAMEAQAYVGTPLLATDGTVLGVVAVVYRHPLPQVASIESMLEIFASRAATEYERKRAEARMRKLSSAVEQTADSVIITNHDGVIEYVNPAFETCTGYSRTEAVGQTPRLVKSGKQSPAFYQKLWQTILSGDVFSDVLINRRKDGSIYYEEKTISPLKDAAGRVTHFISTGKDVTERMQAQERLEYMAQHDALTALPNRALLLDRLKQSVARARWHRRMVAILFVDLDRFKTINDTLGHEAGDQLLQQLGERFSRNVREGDTVGRFGGDEFVILLDDVASDKDIGGVAQKVLDALKSPFNIQHQHLHITASIGISLFPNDGDDGNTLLRNADIAMYRAKELGKNTYQFYSADMSARAFERLSLENSLRRALERQEFVLHYQPQFDVRTGRIFGVEALLRWQHPDFGLVPPSDFIALLEETGLIVTVGEWVLEEAGRQLRAWHTSGYRNLRLAVNLSPRQAQSSHLLGTVQRVLNDVPAESGWLELEITEGLLVQQSQTLMDTFDALRALGVRLAIDDFGTGYSSLSYLRRLPIDTLKVDRSFVRDVPGDADDSAIVTTVIAMAQSLRLEVIAEGVENAEQRDFLSAYGCTRMQGNLLARALPADDITRLLAGAGSGSAPG